MACLWQIHIMSAFSDALPIINGLGLVTNLMEIELGRSVIGFV